MAYDQMKEEERKIYIQEGTEGNYRVYVVPFIVSTAVSILLDAEELVYNYKNLEITDAKPGLRQDNLL